MVVVFTLACVAVTVAVAVLIVRGASRQARTKLRCRGGSILYGPGVTADEAGSLRDHLERVGFFDKGCRGVALKRDAGTYQFLIPFMKGVAHDEEVVARCGVVAAALAGEVFPGSPAEVHLCDCWFRPLTVVPHRCQFGSRLRFNAAEVFHANGVTEGEAIEVGTYLMYQGFFNDNPKLAQLNRAGDAGFELRLEVKQGCASSPALRDEFRRMADDLSRDVLRGVPVEVTACESVRETLRDQQADMTPEPTAGRKVFL